MRRWPSLGVLCGLMLAVLAGRVAWAAPQGTVVVALGSNIPTLDPWAHSARMAIITTNWHIHDNLFMRDLETMKPIPGLALSATPIDNLTWEIKLRRGVKFHNGEPFTAEVVKFNLDRVLDPNNKLQGRAGITWLNDVKTGGEGEAVVVVDDYTVRIRTKEPYPLVHERLTTWPMISKTHFERVGPEGYARNPVGTGPFRFVEWVKGQRLVLEANLDYWMGPPAVKRVIFRPIPEMATQIAELLSGGVHIIRTVPPDQIDYINNSGVAYVTSAPILRVVYLNLDAAGRAEPGNPLTHVKVRRAIAHAIDVDAIIRHVLQGRAVRTATGVNPLHFGYDPTIEGIPYDPQKARQLLAEAGYPDGFHTVLNSYSGSVVNVRQVVEAIMGYLEAVGIKTENRHFEDVGTWIRTMRAGKLNGIGLASWGSGAVFDADALLWRLTKSGEDFSYISDPDIDRWLSAARATLDPQQRLELYSKVQRRLVEQAYWVPLYGQHEILGVSNKLDFRASGDEILKVYYATWR
ncbi:MAG: ABC transporter substrate-binding protein [Candidatus Tectimicrobiota bacterium]|nr:MAG: ABC transporter substrate-binding protein [Candidatus Tectomicrobia bacterium]